MRTRQTVLASAGFYLLTLIPAQAVDVDKVSATLFTNPDSAEAVNAFCDERLDIATAMRTELEGWTGKATVKKTLRAFDDMNLIANGIAGAVGLIAETHPVEDIRSAAEDCQQRLDEFTTDLSLSRPLYDVMAKINTRKANDIEKRVVARNLDAFRRSGVDKSDEVRNRVREINAELSKLSIEFGKNIREDVRSVTITDASRLAGLPEDYIAAHQPDEDGKITITTNYPDAFPIFSYAKDEMLRRDVLKAFRSRGYPKNDAVLTGILENRYELATMLGYANYAALITEDKMVESPEKARAFIEELEAVSRPVASSEYQRILARYRQDKPDAEQVPDYSARYTREQIAKEDYSVDPQQVRQYFAYNNVRDGIIALVEDIFLVEFKPWDDAPIWHEDVAAYEVVDDGEVIGRIFLDMHPRDGKFKHAAAFPIVFGVDERVLPVASLVCNFPKGDHETGLMEHGQVETFLHEFGHLMHMVFSGKTKWVDASMFGLEWDFIEAPSQMLEEWVWDYDTLKGFAKNAEGEVIPKSLVDKMTAARFFGQGLGTMGQLSYADMSLSFYDRAPSSFALQAKTDEILDKYSFYKRENGQPFYANFGHLDGYSAIYYTYQWSLAHAVDMFSRFETEGLRNPATARDYRDKVLGRGGEAPAATLVEDFLGRPYSVEAYKRRLQQGDKTS